MIAVRNEIMQYETELRRVRRELHRIPELGYEEFKTQEYILRYLQSIGIDCVEKLAQTGVKAVIFANGAEGTVAFRSDIDALQMQECTVHDFPSLHAGMMHACGHDGHMAIALCMARYCAEHRESLKKNVVFLFQPAEEGIGGAQRMIDEGALENPKVEQVFGFHLMPDVPEGKFGVKAGPLMAQTCEFDVIFHGKAAHGAMPHLGVDAVAMGIQFYQSVQMILTRTVDPYEQALVTFGRISGGTKRNIVAEEMRLEGTLRTFSEPVYQQILNSIKQHMHAVAESFGGEAELQELVVYSVVNNPPELTARVAELIGEENIIRVLPKMIAEDFSAYQKAVPSVFLFLGCEKEDGNNPPLHSAEFDFNEHVLTYGMELYARILNL